MGEDASAKTEGESRYPSLRYQYSVINRNW